MARSPLGIVRATTLLVAFSFSTSMMASEIIVSGNVRLTGVSAEAPESWLEGGFGRLPAGGTNEESADEALAGELNLALEWQPSTAITAYVHGIGRGETGSRDKWSAGIVEAWGEGLLSAGTSGSFRARAGAMILPTSRENVREFWSSPYLVSYSAINSWIGEEVRPVGLDLEYRYDDGTRSLRIAGTAFGANDTAGTILGWRGWSFGNRLTTLGEELSLPPLGSLDDFFVEQGDGTTPFGDELDGEIGWSARVRFDQWEWLTLQATHYDNRGDRDLHGDEYAWDTTFDLYAFQIRPFEGLTIAAEHMTGSTDMGLSPIARVGADFQSTYILASWRKSWFRASVRYDEFETSERDFSLAELNDERGDSLAFAIVVEPTPNLRAAIEFLNVDANRPGNADFDGPAQNGGDAILMELTYSFGR